MLDILKKMKSKLYRILFVKERPLEDKGERIDIDASSGKVNYEKLDFYQKSHYQRYCFALQHVAEGGTTGDFACGSGYGTVLLSSKSAKAIGVDLSAKVVSEISNRYRDVSNVEFRQGNLLHLSYDAVFDTIVSFETIEHLKEEDIPALFQVFSRALKPGGTFIFSTPYLQERSPEAITLGFHLTFDIDERKINSWLAPHNLKLDLVRYQNYQEHSIVDQLAQKDFIICVARKAA